MPALFIGHGSPMNAIEDNEFSRSWREMGKTLPRSKAILCISAHWETEGVYVTTSAKPETIHDFGGFPQELHDMQYKVSGSPALAQRVMEVVSSAKVKADPQRGLDHGVWSILVHMYPAADIPVVQLSLSHAEPALFHYNLGKELAVLREEGVLVCGCGNIVHNLRSFRFNETKPADWALRFDNQVRELIVKGEHNRLIDFQSLDESRLAVPTPEHYLPLLYTLGMQGAGDKVSFFNEAVMSSISMTSVKLS
jgi:4,5-DOPA dioxygenase extradiol